ncbi:hypothetical protein SPRG_15971 [Saprolegnia parasitica CBS 223.65]|uniref:Uncharacterized protein n=1 Tax=Saprolegnia parasitica (strain CBS 223.65) TaxID=695850 RepID=A0A067BWH5_SAPPC|nr:hypothetical protein SPRG_15971 [Saprolegnia parasitica CBS 223.65]KDO18636.1 hypothetical protein SPRG_15971 [Saprolegnia parasitica CBS 223.65]|eukprot:XP_012210659.1 hypothetical protein SPRG_15971 [Saprolegnia parasitica CBS 223.65]
MQTTPSSPEICRFNGCSNPAIDALAKCNFHRHRLPCSVARCNNIVYARQLCVRHGGKPKCAHDDCDANARPGGFCYRHTEVRSKRLCTQPLCTNAAHARGLCVRHGGGRRCRVDGCKTLARKGGCCVRHREGVACADVLDLALDWIDAIEPLDDAILDCLIKTCAADTSSSSPSTIDVEWYAL